jgi:hypothetical protein
VSRVILCRVGERPRVICLDADPGGDDTAAVERLLGVGLPVACVMLDDGIGLCCDRDVLHFGLALARRALATSPSAPRWPAPMLRFDDSAPALGSDESPVSADFLLARVDADGELVDLTDSDIEHWMVWLGLDDFLNK